MMKRLLLSRRGFLRSGVFTALAAGLGTYPFLIERQLVRVNRYRVPVPHLPEAFNGFTIAHLSDLHYGPLVSSRFIKRVVRTTNQLEADVVVCTGDYVHERLGTDQIDTIWPLLTELRGKHGVFGVLGNHDHWASTQKSLEWLERAGHSMRHKAKAVEKDGQRLWFAGAGDLWEDHVPIDTLLEPVPDNDCRVVLAHNPDSADTPFGKRVDLMLCGHTHGGQVRFPFVGAPVLPVQNKRYSSGFLHSDRGVPMFITRGIGWAILPVRFACLPEIALLELCPPNERRAWSQPTGPCA